MIRPMFIAVLVLLTMAGSAHAGERVIVRMRMTATAAELRGVRAMPIVDVGKRDIPLAQRSALRDVERFVTIDLPDDGSLTLDDVRALPWVEEAYPNRRIPLHATPLPEDPPIALPYGLRIIGAPKVWATATGRGIIVGILDTGIDWTHPDLRPQVLVRAGEDVNGNGTFEPWPSTQQQQGVTGDLDGKDNDGNGFIDDVIGYDFVDQSVRNLGDDRERDAIPFDEQGHGTSVGGVVAAVNSTDGGPHGLAYASRLMALRAFDATGNAEEDDVAAALLYAAMNGANVVNMSFGDGVDAPLMRAAVEAAAAMGCVLVASAGNSGTTSRQYPASYDDVIAVAATNDQDRRAPFSSTGSSVSMSAPGQGIETTRAGGGYRTVNGTSFAAPFVAAAAALLREQHPDWTPHEVTGTLRQSSVDLGDRGWDPNFGDGRLQVDAAMQAIAPTHVHVTSPRNESEVDIRSGGTIPVVGTATSTLFDRYELSLGRGVEPVSWTTLASGEQRIDTTLGSIDASTLAAGPYVVRLAVIMSNGRTLEHRVRISVIDTVLRFTSTDLIQAWHDDRRAAVLTVRSDRPSLLSVVIRRGIDTVRTVVDGNRFTRTHSVVLPGMPSRVALAADITAVASSGDTARTTLQFTMPDDAAPTSGFIERGVMPFTGYVLNDLRDVYSDGSQTIVLNDLSSGTFGATQAYVADGSTWRVKDSIPGVWIPRGMGDANGDGIVDVLCHVVGRTALFQATTPGGSPFGRIIFADTTSGNLQAAGMFDVNGDGREELLCLTDSGLVALSNADGTWRRLGLAVNTTPPATGNAENRYDEISVAAGDLDGDGRVEVAFADTDGDLVVAEWTGTVFRTEFVAQHDGQGGSGYIVSLDVDGDGRKEIVYGVPDSVTPNGEREYGRQVWTYRMYRGLANDDYRLAWEEHFTGLRYGIGYRSGVDVGQLDGSAGSELAICVFPRLYVFTWDTATRSMRPMWYRTDVVSPRMFMRDMNGNGIADIVFGTTTSGNGLMTQMRRAEIDTTSRLPSPSGLRLSIASASSISATWSAVAGAARYVVHLRDGGSTMFRAVDTVTAPMTVIDGLLRDVRYAVHVTVEANGGTPAASQPSRSAEIVIPSTSIPVRIEPAAITREQLQLGASFRVTYDRPTVPDAAERTAVSMIHGPERSVADHVTVLGQSIVDVVFPAVGTDVDTVRIVMPHVPVFDAGSPDVTSFVIPVVQDAATPLYLRTLVVESPQRLRLRFSEPVEARSASVPEFYTLQPTGAIGAVEVLNDDEVSITIDPSQPLGARGISYYLTVRDVQAVSGVRMTTGAGNTLGFTFAAEDVADVYVYPHPAVLGVDRTVTFANIPADARIDVMDQRFTVIATLTETDGNGGVAWDMTTTDGDVVPPGLYLYRVTGAGDDVLRKLVIKR